MRNSFMILQVLGLISVVIGGVVLSLVSTQEFEHPVQSKLVVVTGSLG